VFSLSGGSVRVKNQAYVGYQNKGLFQQDGGAVTVDHELFIGTNKDSHGYIYDSAYTLNAGTLTAGTMLVGYSNGARAILNQNGGVFKATAGVEVGYAGTGVVNLSGGTFNTPYFNVGSQGGSGTVNHSVGGVLNVGTNALALAVATNAVCLYNLGDGATLNVNSEMDVGYGGKATFNQTGGTVNLTDPNHGMMLGYNANSVGTYNLSGSAALNLVLNGAVGYHGSGEFNMSGGTLTAQSFGVGDFGSGAFNQTNGAVILSKFLNVGIQSSSLPSAATGVYNLRGGSVHSNGIGVGANGSFNQFDGSVTDDVDEHVSGLKSMGVYSQYGGSHFIGNHLFIGAGGSNTGSYQLIGGSLSAANLVINGGTFVQSGGSLNASTMILSDGGKAVLGGVQSWAPNASLLAIDGATLTLNADLAPTSSANVRLEVMRAGLAVNATQHLGAVSLSSGTATLGGGVALVGTSLSLDSQSRLGLKSGAASIIAYGSAGASPLTSFRSSIISGFAGGNWGGMGIVCADAALDPALSIGYAEASEILGAGGGVFRGETVDGNSVLLLATHAGDANLDGVVDFSDLVRLAQNYNTTPADSTDSWWIQGDFNYDGVVDFADLVKLAQNYGVAPPAAPIAGASTGFAQDLERAFAEVPEPAGPGAMILAVAGSGLARRRRRSR
jgi:hypothetical protein